MSTRDRRTLLTLQGLLLALPLFLGGRQPLAVAIAALVVIALLVTTARARGDVPDAPHAPGVAALAAFVLVAFVTTLPLPPAVLRALSPTLVERTAALLPGWPGGGAWSVWRSLAIDPYGVAVELARIGIGAGAFVVIVAYPWRSDVWGVDARAMVFGRLLLTAIAAGAVVAGIALVEHVAGNGRIMWITAIDAPRSRAFGSFVNPNHLALWLEMTFPVALAYALAVGARLYRRLGRAALAGRGMGVPARRAWISAIIANQRQLWPPLATSGVAALILVAHVATDSRGGTAALLVGVAATGAGAAGLVWRDGPRRWIVAVAALALVVGSLGSLALWAIADDDGAAVVVEGADVGLAARVEVSAAGLGIVRDHPLFGTGLGSWLDAFRPYQAPPVPGGIWDHAHDDYVELAANTGAVGVALALLFVVAVARAAAPRRGDGTASDGIGSSRTPVATPTGTTGAGAAANGAAAGAVVPHSAGSATLPASSTPHHSTSGSTTAGALPPGFAPSEWLAALAERPLLRWGLVGGVAAVAVHSLVDFGLHLPANLLLAMTLLALLVLSGRPRPAGRSPGVLAVAAVLVLALAPQLANAARMLAGAAPIAPRDALDAADLRLAENDDRDGALALVMTALDRNPFDRTAHEALATTLGAGPAADAALRRALVLEPDSTPTRDRLGLALWDRGERATAVAELEESVRRLPALAAHGYLSPETTFVARDSAQLLRELSEGDSVELRLANVAPEIAGAIERGLTSALDGAAAGPARAAIVDDLATLLEVAERWSAAAALLHAEAVGADDANTYLVRAARDYLKAHEDRPAEETLLAALVQAPDRGELYRKLAVDVYAARGDFKTADIVLETARRNAVDLLPTYRAVNEVLARREASETDSAAVPSVPPLDEPL